MNRWEMQKYELRIGSRGQAVRVLKNLLHFDLRNSYQNDGSEIFDAKLQSSVTEFQRLAGLRNNSGTVDRETWSALGKNQLDARLRLLSFNDSTLYGLLTGNALNASRGLTSGEITLAKEIYKTSINYNIVKIHNERAYVFQPDNVLITPNGEIYVPGNNVANGGCYSSDYSSENVTWKGIFLHEMCHVWQYQRNVKNVRTEAITGRVSEAITHQSANVEVYKYRLSRNTAWGYDNDFEYYGLEQQAAIIEDYYVVYKNNGRWATGRDGRVRYENFYDKNMSEQKLKDLLIFILDKFYRNPGYLGNQP